MSLLFWRSVTIQQCFGGFVVLVKAIS